MKTSGLNTLGALALTIALPLTAEAGLIRIADSELSAVSGQLTVNIDASTNATTTATTAALISSNPLLLPVTQIGRAHV